LHAPYVVDHQKWRELIGGKQSHSDGDNEDTGRCVFRTDLVPAQWVDL